MNFLEYAKEKRVLIEENLVNFFENKITDSNMPDSFKDLEVLENLLEFALKGKMLRGILFLFSCEMLGGKITSKEIDIACAIELTHSALLIHDDIIDNDLTRRGSKTIYAKYIDRGINIEAIDKEHYGRSMGIVVGDIAFFLSFELLSRHDYKLFEKVINFFSREIYNVGFAEGVDSEFGQSFIEPSETKILDVYRLKTARYTFSLPFCLAGVLLKSSSITISMLEQLGENAGLIFQMKDDELGLFGDEKNIGKPTGGDIRENKKTLIRALLFNHVDSDERSKLTRIFGNNQMTKEQFNYVISVCEKYNIRVKTVEEMNKIMIHVWEIFEDLEVDKSYKSVLKEFLEFNFSRVS